MKYLLPILVIILFLLTFTKKETKTMPLTQQDSILAFGDSLTYGFGAGSGQSYPELLSKHIGLNVINAGVNGDTSEDGLRRLAPLLNDPSVKLMILFFGGNDMMQKHSTTTLKQNLRTMIKMAKEKEIGVLLISVPNITLFGLSPLDLYDELADEENVPLLSGMLADILSDPSLKSDQVHPNTHGYRKMEKEIYHALQEYGLLSP